MGFVLDVEVCQKACSTLTEDGITDMVKNKLYGTQEIDILATSTLESSWWDEDMRIHIDSIRCSCENVQKNKILTSECSSIRVFVYRLTEEEVGTETMQCDSEDLPVASHWILPCREFEGLWENLCYDTRVKENLLRYIETSMMFSDRNINPNIINWNKVVLLHGPPGTGKTSLCKALAQKATIRLGKRYIRGELIEINSHSLFSKWFSESGKLVMKLFTEIKRLLEDPHAFLCILIDEVESLAHARKSCMSGTEPSDSIRVVNALLTQLDQIKNYKNALVLTTSNITEAIDLAFVDRADIKQYIGHPTRNAIFLIYSTCIRELMRVGLIEHTEMNQWQSLLLESDLLEASIGLSGRTLRRIPFLAQALYLKPDELCQAFEFIVAMKRTVIEYKKNEPEKY